MASYLIPNRMTDFININSISELHKIFDGDKPKHPLVSVIKNNNPRFSSPTIEIGKKYVLDFYIVSLKYHDTEIKYGRNYYDFQEGSLLFMSPGQVIEPSKETSTRNDDGWSLYFHQDLIRNSDLVNKMDTFSFFSYGSNEALHISEHEKKTILDCIDKIQFEYSQNIDRHSQGLIVSNIELLLNYCLRFYERQFITRTHVNNDTISEFERFLKNYFKTNQQLEQGIPTVKQCAEAVHLSANYLSDLLKKETGKNAQEHIHSLIIELAKNQLLSTALPISEIAYSLGFESPSYFTKVFKAKTGLSPLMYRSQN